MTTKQIEDYPELQEWLDCNAYNPVPDILTGDNDDFVEYLSVAEKLLEQQAKIDSLTEQLSDRESRINGYINDVESLTEQNKELQERNSKLSEYRFKHPRTGDEKLVMINRQFIIDRLIDEIYENIECNCAAFAEDYDFCDCNEYFEEFELVELNKESK